MCQCFLFNQPATTWIYTLSLHDALPIWSVSRFSQSFGSTKPAPGLDEGVHMVTWGIKMMSAPNSFVVLTFRSEEHTSELQSRRDLVCRLLLEKKNVC